MCLSLISAHVLLRQSSRMPPIYPSTFLSFFWLSSLDTKDRLPLQMPTSLSVFGYTKCLAEHTCSMSAQARDGISDLPNSAVSSVAVAGLGITIKAINRISVARGYLVSPGAGVSLAPISREGALKASHESDIGLIGLHAESTCACTKLDNFHEYN